MKTGAHFQAVIRSFLKKIPQFYFVNSDPSQCNKRHPDALTRIDGNMLLMSYLFRLLLLYFFFFKNFFKRFFSHPEGSNIICIFCSLRLHHTFFFLPWYHWAASSYSPPTLSRVWVANYRTVIQRNTMFPLYAFARQSIMCAAYRNRHLMRLLVRSLTDAT